MPADNTLPPLILVPGHKASQPRAEMLDGGKVAEVWPDLRQQLQDGAVAQTIDAREVDAGSIGHGLAHVEGGLVLASRSGCSAEFGLVGPQPRGLVQSFLRCFSTVAGGSTGLGSWPGCVSPRRRGDQLDERACRMGCDFADM